MRMLRPSSEPEMIAEFLRQEYASKDRYGATITACLQAERLSPEIIRQADITNDRENAQRRQVLARYRGYGTQEPSYLTSFPDHGVAWDWAMLTAAELLDACYIRYKYWTALSAGSRSPVIAAERIRQGFEVYGVSNERSFDIAALIGNGITLPPLILVTIPAPIKHVVLEGNSRLTAYALGAHAMPSEVQVMIGTGHSIAGWDEY